MIGRIAVTLSLVMVACGSAETVDSTTTTTSSTTTSTTTTTTVVLPDAPYADQLYTHTVAQLESLMRGFLGFECDEWTLEENGADRGACLQGEEGTVLFRYETFPGSVRLRADRALYESEWTEMYADPSVCGDHAGDHAAVGHSWIVFAQDRAPIDVITDGTGAVYLPPPDCG